MRLQKALFISACKPLFHLVEFVCGLLNHPMPDYLPSLSPEHVILTGLCWLCIGLERLLGPSLPQHGPRSLAVPALTPKFFEQGVGLNPHLTVPPVIFHGHGFAQALPRAF